MEFDEDRCTQFRFIVVTDPQTTKKQTNKQTHRQDRLQYTAPQLTRSAIIMLKQPITTTITVTQKVN